MATITRRKHGWQAEVRRKGFRPVSRQFTNRGEAIAWARKVESDMDRRTYVDLTTAERTTLRDALDRYEKEITPHKKGKVQEASRLGVLRNGQLAPMFLTSIRSSDVAAYRDARQGQVGPKTVCNELALLSHVFTTAAREWRMEGLHNPVAAVRKPKLPRGRERRVEVVATHSGTASELERIIAATESAELPAILILLVETAMRRSELAELCWASVNLRERWLRLEDTKNGHARTVPLTARATELLSKLPRRLDGKVFGMTRDAITRAFIRARARAGIADLRLHDLRHEATTRLFERYGMNPIEAAAITGHRDPRMLARYTHLTPQALLKKLDAA